VLGVGPVKGTKTAQPLIRPGGAQTRVKLSILGDYLKQFARASQRSWHRYYVDGFAGAGEGIDPRTGEHYDGSARLCFDVDPPFTRCFLIENDAGRADKLNEIAALQSNATVIQGDVNVEIGRALEQIEPQAATIAFLDPEGTELHWKTIEMLAVHKVGHSATKIELLVLFPLQMAVLRLLDFNHGVVPEGHIKRLEAMLGAESPWLEIWRGRLLGQLTTPEETRAAFLDAYCHQLHGLGYRHVLAREVSSEGDRGRPLYYLVFASDHDAGKRIMKHEFGASHTEQGTLFSPADYTEGLVYEYDPDRERPYRY
jgi:three-Cys-motif partner protein